jgi:DNA-binding NarL/FixJ family response regulator
MEGHNQVIKTAVVEDMRDIREGLTTLLNFTEGFNCTGSYRSMEEAIPRIAAQVPDVLLSDIGLPGHGRYRGDQDPQGAVSADDRSDAHGL